MTHETLLEDASRIMTGMTRAEFGMRGVFGKAIHVGRAGNDVVYASILSAWPPSPRPQ
jgi:hypothetical protein